MAELLLFTEDFQRVDLYAAFGPQVATADWRGVVGWLRSRTGPARVIIELSSARALDVVRALMGDPALTTQAMVGVAMDPAIADQARRLGLTSIVADGDWDGMRRELGDVIRPSKSKN